MFFQKRTHNGGNRQSVAVVRGHLECQEDEEEGRGTRADRREENITAVLFFQASLGSENNPGAELDRARTSVSCFFFFPPPWWHHIKENISKRERSRPTGCVNEIKMDQVGREGSSKFEGPTDAEKNVSSEPRPRCAPPPTPTMSQGQKLLNAISPLKPAV